MGLVPHLSLMRPRTAIGAALGAIALALVAISPPADRAADANRLVHYAEHGVIFLAGLFLAAALRDLWRSTPWTPAKGVAAGGLAVILEIAAILPPLDRAVETNQTLHFTQHGLIFAGGALMGVALRDILLLGMRGSAARGSST